MQVNVRLCQARMWRLCRAHACAHAIRCGFAAQWRWTPLAAFGILAGRQPTMAEGMR